MWVFKKFQRETSVRFFPLLPLKIVHSSPTTCVVLRRFRIDGLQMESQFGLIGYGQSALDLTHFSSPLFTKRKPQDSISYQPSPLAGKTLKH